MPRTVSREQDTDLREFTVTALDSRKLDRLYQDYDEQSADEHFRHPSLSDEETNDDRRAAAASDLGSKVTEALVAAGFDEADEIATTVVMLDGDEAGLLHEARRLSLAELIPDQDF